MTTKKRAAQATKAIEHTATKSASGALEAVGKLKVQVCNAFDDVANWMSRELHELRTVGEAIEAKKAELQELHNIDAAATSHEELLAKHGKTKDELHAAYEGVLEARAKDEKEYAYNRDLARKQDNDNWQQSRLVRQRLFDVEIETKLAGVREQQSALDLAEDELVSLRAKVAGHDEHVGNEVGKHVAVATSSLKKELEMGFALERAANGSALKLKEQELVAVNNQLVSVRQELANAQASYKSAADSVKEIAAKAIDGASKQHFAVNLPGQETVAQRGRG